MKRSRSLKRSKSLNKKKFDNNDSVIFVFYDLKEKENWTYKKFPKNWT